MIGLCNWGLDDQNDLIKSKMIYLGRKEARRDESNDKNKADSDGRIPD